MPETFACPTCGAPLEPNGSESTIRCSYCDTSVVVPETLREQKTDTVFVSMVTLPDGRATPASPRGGRLGCGLAAVILGIVLIVLLVTTIPSIIAGLAVSRSVSLIPSIEETVAPLRSLGTQMAAEMLPTASPTPGYARAVLTFGSQGIGPGQMKDARSIALDPGGLVYVGEYTGGRVQVFDASGKYLRQIRVDAEMPLRGLAVHPNGDLLVVQAGKITCYDGKTGQALGSFLENPPQGIDAVTITPAGEIVVISTGGRDDVSYYTADGKPIRTIAGAISEQTGRSELILRAAVDGLGNLYLLGIFNQAVIKYDASGRYVDRWGGPATGAGETPGAFRSPSDIAVDGQGRVLVSDFAGMQVFDSNGRFLGQIEDGGTVTFGLAVDRQDRIWAASRTEVRVLEIGK